jgi:Cu/Ag efflux protein CusF
MGNHRRCNRTVYSVYSTAKFSIRNIDVKSRQITSMQETIANLRKGSDSL